VITRYSDLAANERTYLAFEVPIFGNQGDCDEIVGSNPASPISRFS